MTPEQQALLDKAAQSIAAAGIPRDDLSFSRHSGVIAAFGRHFAKSGELPVDLHRYLREGQDLRNAGDYGIGPGLTETDAIEQIRRAEVFGAEVRRLLSG